MTFKNTQRYKRA